jgi:hypothetical protein
MPRNTTLSKTVFPKKGGTFNPDLPEEASRQRGLICPNCGYIARTSAKWIRIGMPTCPCGTKLVLRKLFEQELERQEAQKVKSVVMPTNVPVAADPAVDEIKRTGRELNKLVIKHQTLLEVGQKPDSDLVVNVQKRIDELTRRLGEISDAR